MKSLLVLLDAYLQQDFDVNIQKATEHATFIFLTYFWGDTQGTPYKITIVWAYQYARPEMASNTANLHMTLTILVERLILTPNEPLPQEVFHDHKRILLRREVEGNYYPVLTDILGAASSFTLYTGCLSVQYR